MEQKIIQKMCFRTKYRKNVLRCFKLQFKTLIFIKVLIAFNTSTLTKLRQSFRASDCGIHIYGSIRTVITFIIIVASG